MKIPATAPEPGPDTALLERILWSQIIRLVHETPPAWDARSPSARMIHDVLHAPVLDADEMVIAQRWDSSRETTRALFDQLLQARVNRAVRDGLSVEADRLGVPRPEPPRIAVVRGDDRAPGAAAGKRTAIELLKGTQIVDIAGLEPGEHLDDLVDLLVLANQSVSQELLSTLKVEAAFHREDQPIDLMVPQTPSVQVFDLERALARLEEILRGAIPENLRPKGSGDGTFERDLTGELLGGKYRIKALKGKGAFKSVYEGLDEMLGARVAIAVLNPKGSRSHRALEHFQDEARVLTTLDHENIVRWITFDRTADKLHYFVMEYLDGEELEKVLRREGRLAPKRVAQILLQVLAALRRAHALGKRGRLLHLDLKPENVFVLPALVPGEPERVKVIDFGIGQHVGAEVRAAERPQMSSIYDLPTEELGKSIGSMQLPDDESGVPGRVQRARGGTLLYASPEQSKHLAGHRDIVELDGRSDLYSLGVMAYRMLTGQFPFAKCDSAYQAIENHLTVPPRKVGSLGIKVPRKLAAFVDKCLIKNRDRRWKNANEAYAFLETYVRPKVSAIKVALPIAAIGAAGIVAVSTMDMGEPVPHRLEVLDAGQPISVLWVGRDDPKRTLDLNSNRLWTTEDRPEVRLVNSSDVELEDWSADWSSSGDRSIEIFAGDNAIKQTAYVELSDSGESWITNSPLTLNILGDWKIEGVDPRPQASKRLDPRGRNLVITVSGDPVARDQITSISLWHGDKELITESGVKPEPGVERTKLEGPPLDSLLQYKDQLVELRVVARDRAGQPREKPFELPIAGDQVAFAGVGFIDAADPEGRFISPAEGTHVIFPRNELLILLTGRGSVSALIKGIPVWAEPIDIDRVRRVSLDSLGIRGEKQIANLELRVDDETWVDRIGAEPKSEKLGFRFYPELPVIDAQLGTGLKYRKINPQRAAVDSDQATHFDASGQVKLLVTPDQLMPLWFESTLISDGSGEVMTGPISKPCSMSSSAEFDLEFPREGRFRIVIAGCATVGDNVKGQKILEQTYLIEVDTTKPVIEVPVDGASVETRNGTRFIKASLPEKARVIVAENTKLSSVSWTLRFPDGTAKNKEFTDEAEIDLTDIDLRRYLPTDLEDGPYELLVKARDAAGNLGEYLERWQIATKGPEVRIVDPRPNEEGVWSLDSSEGWNIVVDAKDPNDIEEVQARVICQRIPPSVFALEESGDRWRLPLDRRPCIPFWSTGEELTIVVTAIDKGGNRSEDQTLSAKIPEIPRPARVRIASRERPDEIMVEVPVPANLDYLFGGRNADDDATSGFQRECWNVKIQGASRGTNGSSLRSYFLDEREVSRGEFLEFVQAGGGYLNEDWWPSGESGPDRSRHERWNDELVADDQRPVTRITWAEAFAYARWRGKRLPNMVQWEFAVRGSQYADAPETLANLCSGPREWTSNLERYASQFRKRPETLFEETPSNAEARIVEAGSKTGSPTPPVQSHWAVGSYATDDPSWADKRLESDAADDLGFRCALDQEIVYELCKTDRFELVR